MVKRPGRRQVVAVVAVGAVLVAVFAAGGEREGSDAGARVAQIHASVGADDEARGDAFAATETAAAFGPAAPKVAQASGAGGGTASADAATSGAPPLPAGLTDAKVVKTASLEVEVAEGRFGAAFSKVPTIAAAHGGFVASSTSSVASPSGDDHAAGSLVLRIPADRFDAARQELSRLGKVRSEQLRGDEVGGQLADLDARLRNLRSQEEAMRLLMTKATTVGETIEVQRQLGTVREQIEQLSAQQARLGDAVALSTITVAVLEPGAALRSPEGPSPVSDAFARAVRGAERVVAGVIVSLGYLLPLALLGGLAWLLSRPVGRLRRSPDEAAPAAP